MDQAHHPKQKTIALAVPDKPTSNENVLGAMYLALASKDGADLHFTSSQAHYLSCG
ncbi:hypothetical protein J2Z48_001931 [Croceifilum oryzae]|uniref:Uncharacterized protein n=1 Tax=Croceifilum oryzae TaxID=1553429 RepID=A0AAJ1WSU4_9BACL|nr:hypothetical protein [Croceifilum oryzae]MDQ0417758.1 hypothetical protein [Croceifilum oryzae]